MHDHDVLPALAALLAVGALLFPLFRRVGLGSILGFLVGGAVIGPSGAGLVHDAAQARRVSEIGIGFLLFVIGLELHPTRLRGFRPSLLLLGLAQVSATALVLRWVGPWFGLPGATQPIVVIGLAMSSTAIVLQAISERGDLAREYGRAVLATLLVQDLVAIPLLAFLGVAARVAEPSWSDLLLLAGRAVAALALVAAGVRGLLWPALRFAAHARSDEGFFCVVLLAVLGPAWLADALGVSGMLGAFLAGLLLATSPYRLQIEATVEPFRAVLLGLFFVSIGMSAELRDIGPEVLRVSGLAVTTMALKALVLAGLALLVLRRADASLRVALSLPQAGEFGFVLFALTADRGSISHGDFERLVLLVAVSMALTPLLFPLTDALAERLGRRRGQRVEPLEQAVSHLDRHVIVAGFGRVGETVGLLLARCEIPWVAIEFDGARVAECTRLGLPVLFGDATDPRVLRAAGAGRARLLVVTLDRSRDADRVVGRIRGLHPGLQIAARARDLAHGLALRRAGASAAVPEGLEAGLRLGESVLLDAGVADDRVDDLVEDLRRDDYAVARRLLGGE